jgi:hypothetical protein
LRTHDHDALSAIADFSSPRARRNDTRSEKKQNARRWGLAFLLMARDLFVRGWP